MPPGEYDGQSKDTGRGKSQPTPEDTNDSGRSNDNEDEGERGEADVSADVGSTGSNDRVTDDFARDEERVSTGFFGKASGVAWVQRARHEVYQDNSGDNRENATTNQQHQGSTQTGFGQDQGYDDEEDAPGSPDDEGREHLTTYLIDDRELRFPQNVNPYELPPRLIADAFVEAYFTTVHSTFPLLAKGSFLAQVHKIYEPYARPVSKRWRAILNLVFAIGAKYSVLTRAHWCEEADHLVFFSRARMLGLDYGALWEMGDIEQVQMLSLAAFYLIASNHLNR
jgi:hypothetical protein